MGEKQTPVYFPCNGFSSIEKARENETGQRGRFHWVLELPMARLCVHKSFNYLFLITKFNKLITLKMQRFREFA